MPKGFTLIELLVVIAIMAVVGTFTLANFREFGKDKELHNAALDIQSLLRTAQTNALSGVKCGNDTASNWFVEFIPPLTINLKCNNVVTPVKILVLGNNIELGTIENTSSGVPCASSVVKFNFASLTGAFLSDCNNSSTMEVGVQNIQGSVKLVKVTAGSISIAEGVAVSPSPSPSGGI